MAGNHAESDKEYARQMFVDFDGEMEFWRDHYRSSGFYRPGMEFKDYEPAVKLGINAFLRSHGRSFDELREHLEHSYYRTRNGSPLEWSEASAAAATSWDRMSERSQARINGQSSRGPVAAAPRTTRPARMIPSAPPAAPAAPVA